MTTSVSTPLDIKRFHIADVLSVLTGVTLPRISLETGEAPQDVPPIHGLIEVVEHVTGKTLSNERDGKSGFNPWELMSSTNLKAKPFLSRHFPELAKIPAPDFEHWGLSAPEVREGKVLSQPEIDYHTAEWLLDVMKKHGEYVEVPTMALVEERGFVGRLQHTTSSAPGDFGPN